jgi:23S rRNA pseudouridine1911/1915/1917 synthase
VASAVTPEALPLAIVYEDADCLVLNKASGMVVHPAAGWTQGTLVNALLHHCPDLPGIGGEKRPGIVHRLDKDTSGLMVVAKHDAAFHSLAAQFKARSVGKEYLALAWGRMQKTAGAIERPIGRHRSDRKKMSSVRALGRAREALTEWRVGEVFSTGAARGRFAEVSLLRLTLHSGRTHQIRVHLADEGHAVVGDPVYGPRPSALRGQAIDAELVAFPRQALHAEALRFTHPCTGRAMEFHAPPAPDMARLLEMLRAGSKQGSKRG